MPLWEGFDELYHYGYLQHLVNRAQFPRVGNSPISGEEWSSLGCTPVSHAIAPYFGRPSISFETYFATDASQRRAWRACLDTLNRELQNQSSPLQNYEAKQAPLTYVVLAPIEFAFRGAALSFRILLLRLLLGLLATGLLWRAAIQLGSRLQLADRSVNAALFMLFSCQMLYATSCHIANDALLAPWLLFYVINLIDTWNYPHFLRFLLASVILAAGLLIKASTIVFVPFVFLIALRRAPRQVAVISAILLIFAAPWYTRNLLLYRNLTATFETSGLGFGELISTAAALPWRNALLTTLHRAIWTGNNSFTTFSAITINLLLLSMAGGMLLYLFHFRMRPPEVILLAVIATYLLELVVIAISFFHSSQGQVNAPMPWYTQLILPPIVLLIFAGCERVGLLGTALAFLMLLLSTYIAAMTWLAKLIPMYGGFPDSHAHPKALLSWYLVHHNAWQSILATLCPAPLPVLYALCCGMLLSLLYCAARLLGSYSPLALLNKTSSDSAAPRSALDPN